MGAVVQEPCARHRKLVFLRVDGRSRAEIARELGYSSPQAVSNVLAKKHVKAYYNMLFSRLEDSLTDANRHLRSDLVEFAAEPRKATA